MSKSLLDRSTYDHPEHFDDEIRAYRSSKRYFPTPLENLLYELASHRCTVCHAPWLEIHHIDELSEGGATEYDNLIVLCPNCHTRVHAEGIPSKTELRHYKLKQEIAYGLPVLSRLTEHEWDFVRTLAEKNISEQLAYSERTWRTVTAPTQEEAIEKTKIEVGYLTLQESEIVVVELGFVVTLASGNEVDVTLHSRVTGKGVKWIRYLKETKRIPQVIQSYAPPNQIKFLGNAKNMLAR
jgi:HNH endonuclease